MPSPQPHSARACPICGKPTEQAMRPFCSRRCADVDLHRWLSDSYVIPGMRDEEEEAASSLDDGRTSSGQGGGKSL